MASRRIVPIAALADEPFVTIAAERHWLSQSKLLARCHASGLTPRSVIQVDAERLQIALVRQGLGLGFVNASVRFTLPSDVVLRPVRELTVGLDLDLVWLRHNGGGLIGAFRDMVEQYAAGTSDGRHVG
ncbi:hypothetical protein GL174_03875 [Sphingobium sp. CAP-1]|nr:hypothetical protein GL174_03875 [Sphingobium sp. CAP-1]